MARRRRSNFSVLLTLSILALAVYGGWVLYHHHDVQKNISKVSRSVEAGAKVWK